MRPTDRSRRGLFATVRAAASSSPSDPERRTFREPRPSVRSRTSRGSSGIACAAQQTPASSRQASVDRSFSGTFHRIEMTISVSPASAGLPGFAETEDSASERDERAARKTAQSKSCRIRLCRSDRVPRSPIRRTLRSGRSCPRHAKKPACLREASVRPNQAH